MQFNDLKLCQTCLSRDRLLYPIKVLNYLFEELNIYVVNEGSICWECKFTMIKLSNFKKRVKEAQELLTFQPQTHRTLSRLGTHVTNSIDIFYNNDDPLTINTKFEHIKIEIQEHQEATNIDDTNETTDLNKEFFDEIDVEIDPEVKVEFKDELSLDLVKKSEDNVDNVRDKFSTIMYNEQELMDVREEKKNHPNFRKMPFICHSCVLGFTKRETYDVHVKSKHDETNGDYVCDVCHIRFRTLRIMEFHRQIHFVTYKCNLCKYEGKSLRSIISHCESKHEKDCVGIINCKQCDVTAKTQEEMAEHIRIKHLLFCAECGEKFKDRGGLRKHVMRIHRANREFICDFCRKSFKTKSKLESHIVIHNSTLAMNLSYCRVCNVQYKNIYVYRNHLKNSPNHSERSYPCEHCDKSFVSKVYWQKHQDFYHLKKTKFKCDVCDKPFISKWRLMNHKQIHHGLTRPRNYSCDQCAKKFYTLATLKTHQLIHSEQRSYMCQECGDTFKQSAALYTHTKLTHRGKITK